MKKISKHEMEKIYNYAMMIILALIMACTIITNGLPLWAYVAGIFGPILIWYWLEPHKVLYEDDFIE